MRFRLLVAQDLGHSGPAGSGPFDSGPFNMGVDEALLASALASGVTTLRFYTWQGPWLSVGYAQPLAPARRRALARSGVGFVRRVTGGRAVLHGADLTYSISAPAGVLPDGVRESYGVIADILLGALAGFGVNATRSAPDSRAPGPGVFDCFEAPAADEICLEARKLSGSAQRRVGEALLQHGSIRLGPDPDQASRAVTAGSAGLGATSLKEAGFAISAHELAQACTAAFEQHLSVCFEPGELTSEERAHAISRGEEPASASQLRGARGAEFL